MQYLPHIDFKATSQWSEPQAAASCGVERTMTVVEIKRPEASHIWQREEHEHYVEPEWCSKRA